jgi:hypothetical protein
LSGLLSTLTTVPWIRLPSASPTRCDGLAAVSFHHRTVTQRLVALDVSQPQLIRGLCGESVAHTALLVHDSAQVVMNRRTGLLCVAAALLAER